MTPCEPFSRVGQNVGVLENVGVSDEDACKEDNVVVGSVTGCSFRLKGEPFIHAVNLTTAFARLAEYVL